MSVQRHLYMTYKYQHISKSSNISAFCSTNNQNPTNNCEDQMAVFRKYAKCHMPKIQYSIASNFSFKESHNPEILKGNRVRFKSIELTSPYAMMVCHPWGLKRIDLVELDFSSSLRNPCEFLHILQYSIFLQLIVFRL